MYTWSHSGVFNRIQNDTVTGSSIQILSDRNLFADNIVQPTPTFILHSFNVLIQVGAGTSTISCGFASFWGDFIYNQSTEAFAFISLRNLTYSGVITGVSGSSSGGQPLWTVNFSSSTDFSCVSYSTLYRTMYNP